LHRLSTAHERYRQTTDGQTTDGRATVYSEREREFAFANNYSVTHRELFHRVRFQAVVEGEFIVRWMDDVLICINCAVGGSAVDSLGIPSGRLSTEPSGDFVLARLANSHPDGGQVFFPPPGRRPFVMLMAPAEVGDDVRPEHFRAFYFDGDEGFQIAPRTWHNPPYFRRPPVDGVEDVQMVFRNKQSSVFACVWADTFDEFGVFLKFPLTLDS